MMMTMATTMKIANVMTMTMTTTMTPNTIKYSSYQAKVYTCCARSRVACIDLSMIR